MWSRFGFSEAGEELMQKSDSLFPIRPEGKEAKSEGAKTGVKGDEDEEEEQDEEEGGEEAILCKPCRDPGAPTQAEIDAHEATHLPYRSWCPVCVAGRRDNPQHRRREDGDREVPEVIMDYAFIRRQNETETLTVLIVKDRDTRAIRGAVMRHKGVCLDEASDRAADIIRSFGHKGKIILKVDNESALKALREEVMKRLPEGVIPIQPPAVEWSRRKWGETVQGYATGTSSECGKEVGWVYPLRASSNGVAGRARR